MYTDLESSPPQFRAICNILASLDLTKPDLPVIIKPETITLMDAFSEADWDLFVRMAKAEGVAPLMHFAFSHSTYPLPEATRSKLLASYYETAAFNQMILVEMARVVGALNSANIPVIVLKGAALATTIYPDPALRPMSDLDLLVKSEDLERAKAVIISLGYHEPIPEMARGFNKLAKFHFHFLKDDPANLNLELHWNVIAGVNDKRTPPVQWFWDTKVNFQIKEGSGLSGLYSLSFEIHYLYLIAHIILQHGKSEGRLLWFYDLFLMASHMEKPLDWMQTIQLAKTSNWISALYVALQKLNVYFGMKMPIELSQEISNYPADIESDIILLKWEGQSTSRTNALGQLISTRGWKKIPLLTAYFFPNEAYMRWRYHYRHRWQVFFYYPFRWWGIIVKGLQTLNKRFFINRKISGG